MFADDGSLMELLDVVGSLIESLHVAASNYMKILALDGSPEGTKFCG